MTENTPAVVIVGVITADAAPMTATDGHSAIIKGNLFEIISQRRRHRSQHTITPQRRQRAFLFQRVSNGTKIPSSAICVPESLRETVKQHQVSVITALGQQGYAVDRLSRNIRIVNQRKGEIPAVG